MDVENQIMLDTDYPLPIREFDGSDAPAPDLLAILAQKCPHHIAALVISHLPHPALHSGAKTWRFESRKGLARLFNLK